LTLLLEGFTLDIVYENLIRQIVGSPDGEVEKKREEFGMRRY
jgi:hypothetical protein